MIDRLRREYHKSQFETNIFSLIFNPFWIARRSIFQEMSKLSMSDKFNSILDVGCGTKPYQSLFHETKYTGLEYDSERSRLSSKADFFYTNNNFPFGDDEFDLVICNQVLEHVFEPDLFLKEIHRVLKKNGKIILTVPFCWDEHEQPYDYARYTSFGLRYLFEKNNFKVEQQNKLTSGVLCITQILTGYLFKIISTKKHCRIKHLFFLVFIALIIAPVNIIGFILSKVFPTNNDLFLDNLIVGKKVE
jgi:SAM-dependent methyltransferase